MIIGYTDTAHGIFSLRHAPTLFAAGRTFRQENVPYAEALRDLAAGLEHNPAEIFRAASYNRAAETVDRLAMPLSQLFSWKGIEGLRALPSFEPHISTLVAGMIRERAPVHLGD